MINHQNDGREGEAVQKQPNASQQFAVLHKHFNANNKRAGSAEGGMHMQ